MTTLEDDEIVLRRPIDDDVPAIAAACQDPDIPRWTPVPSPYTEDDARSFVEYAREHAVFAITERGSGELLGMIEVHEPEDGASSIGYWMKKESRGRGLAARALELVSRWAITDLGAARVWLVTEPDNVASQRVAEKAGFRREGLLRSYIEIKGRRRDCVMFSLLPSDLDRG